VDDLAAGADHAVVEVEVTAPARRSADVERRVESEPAADFAPARHVAAGAHDAGADREERRAVVAVEAPDFGAAVEALARLEQALRVGAQLGGEDAAGHAGHLFAVEAAGERGEPAGFGARVVV